MMQFRHMTPTLAAALRHSGTPHDATGPPHAPTAMPIAVPPPPPRAHAEYRPNMALPSVIRDDPRLHGP